MKIDAKTEFKVVAANGFLSVHGPLGELCEQYCGEEVSLMRDRVKMLTDNLARIERECWDRISSRKRPTLADQESIWSTARAALAAVQEPQP